MLKPLIVVGVLLIIGLAFGAIGGRQIVTGIASRSWPSVEGTVTNTTVDVDTTRSRRSNSNRRRTTTSYFAVVEYSYTVNGRTFTSDRISAGEPQHGTSNRAAADSFLTRYPKGGGVSVYYDPRDPASAVLQKGAAGVASWFMALGGLAALGGAGWITWRTLR